MEGRKVLLLIDNCPAHPKDHAVLQNTHIHFLPPNMTSKLQPCDAGIIRSLKGHYRCKLNKTMLAMMEENTFDIKNIDILTAIQMVVDAWINNVTAQTITNCFRHCGIKTA